LTAAASRVIPTVEAKEPDSPLLPYSPRAALLTNGSLLFKNPLPIGLCFHPHFLRAAHVPGAY
jgi:hypothetical protein